MLYVVGEQYKECPASAKWCVFVCSYMGLQLISRSARFYVAEAVVLIRFGSIFVGYENVGFICNRLQAFPILCHGCMERRWPCLLYKKRISFLLVFSV